MTRQSVQPCVLVNGSKRGRTKRWQPVEVCPAVSGKEGPCSDS